MSGFQRPLRLVSVLWFQATRAKLSILEPSGQRVIRAQAHLGPAALGLKGTLPSSVLSMCKVLILQPHTHTHTPSRATALLGQES